MLALPIDDRQIDEPRLESDTGYRFQYVAQFIGFGATDIEAIHAAAPLLAPIVPQLVDAVYEKLLSSPATRRHFVPRQHGYDGPLPALGATLTHEHPQIQFRKQHLARYLVRLVTGAYDNALIEYLNLVGQIHTPQAGNPALDVPLVQMNALLGFVASALLGVITSLGLDRGTELRTLLAFNKLLWIQNDLITRHYQGRFPGRRPEPALNPPPRPTPAPAS